MKKRVLIAIGLTLVAALAYMQRDIAYSLLSIDRFVIFNDTPSDLENFQLALSSRVLWEGDIKQGKRKIIFVRIEQEGAIEFSFDIGHQRYLLESYGYVTPASGWEHGLRIDADMLMKMSIETSLSVGGASAN